MSQRWVPRAPRLAARRLTRNRVSARPYVCLAEKAVHVCTCELDIASRGSILLRVAPPRFRYSSPSWPPPPGLLCAVDEADISLQVARPVSLP